MLFAFVLPLTQYCFQPWRKRTRAQNLSKIDKEVVISDENKEKTTDKHLEDEIHNDLRSGQIESHVNAACADEEDETNKNKLDSSANEKYLNARSNEESRIELDSHTNVAFELVEKDETTEEDSNTIDEHKTDEHSGSDSVEVTEECETHL